LAVRQSNLLLAKLHNLPNAESWRKGFCAALVRLALSSLLCANKAANGADLAPVILSHKSEYKNSGWPYSGNLEPPFEPEWHGQKKIPLMWQIIQKQLAACFFT
jgi:hypothetical protein